ncbi:F0F1 ATP synthase subunit epsilon [Mycoplasma capricolum subsp. capricolum]|uniref:F0F1 ATP synthase subunit epsilon n=1 Tax=Mycoplasma capricolum TaxID=2095 RepID=UPI003DA52D2D
MGIKLKILTPNGAFVEDKEVDIINLKTIDGNIGVLENMAPFVTALRNDTLSFKEKNKYTYIHLDQGLVFINSKECKIITEKLYLVDKQDKELATPLKLI